jgi:hypothetical protein
VEAEGGGAERPKSARRMGSAGASRPGAESLGSTAAGSSDGRHTRGGTRTGTGTLTEFPITGIASPGRSPSPSFIRRPICKPRTDSFAVPGHEGTILGSSKGVQVMTVQEVLERGDSLVGSEITVNGFIVLTWDSSWLAPAENRIEDETERLLVRQPGLRQNLYANVPAWVGGPYFYQDRAVVRGTLILSGDSHFRYALSSLTSLEVTILLKKYRVPLDLP